MANSKSVFSASSSTLDPTLTSLFSSSSGPVKVPVKSRYVDLLPQRVQSSENSSEDEEEDVESDDEETAGSQASAGSDDSDQYSASENGTDSDEDASRQASEDDEAAAAQLLEEAFGQKGARTKKRKQRDEDDDLEDRYLRQLIDDDEPSGKRQKGEKAAVVEEAQVDDDASSTSEVLVHESLSKDPAATELDKANRTIFLSNVSYEAVTSKKAKKTLLAHLSSVFEKDASPQQTIESIRFRSTAYASAAIPKRAAFAKKEVMDATTKSTNAYVVYSSPASSRAAVSQLNGTVVLDRHIRVDSVAHPAAVDHKRCVFVGNLGFVDDESVLSTKVDEEGNEVTERRKRNKAPMDVEEGLWRTFGKEAGKVESVRVVRDAATRVGKGFAYVQFYDANAVEAALTLSGKKFPPMLPRELRVSRCKAPHKTARAMEAKKARVNAGSDSRKKKATGYAPKQTAESQTLKGRAGKLLGRAGAAQMKDGSGKRKQPNDADGKPFKSPEQFIFEGRRASSKDGKPKDLKFKGSKQGRGRAQRKFAKDGRGAKRAAKWRSEGGAK